MFQNCQVPQKQAQETSLCYIYNSQNISLPVYLSSYEENQAQILTKFTGELCNYWSFIFFYQETYSRTEAYEILQTALILAACQYQPLLLVLTSYLFLV